MKAAGWFLRVLVTLMTAAMLLLAGKVTLSGLVCSDTTAANAIVLGMALEDGEPTSEFLSRLDTAIGYLRKNPDTVLILTGRNPDASGRTEAAVIHEILAGRGIGEDRMILEDRAENTRENFKNSTRLIGTGNPVVLISSDYHMDRAVQTALSAGFTEVQPLPAPSSLLYFGSDVMGEVLIELGEMTLTM